VLGQVKVADKSNEIIAIPALLDMLVIEGAIITTDAIGCQRHPVEATRSLGSRLSAAPGS
jgi:predicted transposase YbfD/YdcC